MCLKDIVCWNELLKEVKNSVLILFLMFSQKAKENLIKRFDPEVRNRIYFVGAAPKWLHLHRLRGMDLILDFFYYGAHTTAGDALSQVPIATGLGEAMESRVCSSMQRASGLWRQEYAEFARRCASDPDFYRQIRESLKGGEGYKILIRN